jgi:hypothetical protein
LKTELTKQQKWKKPKKRQLDEEKKMHRDIDEVVEDFSFSFSFSFGVILLGQTKITRGASLCHSLPLHMVEVVGEKDWSALLSCKNCH